jgi:hypothetical protein
MVTTRSVLAATLALGLESCAPLEIPSDYGHGYSIGHEKNKSPIHFSKYRSVLYFHGERVTDQTFELSPSTRFVFFEAYGNWYLFDSVRQRTRFLRAAPFGCTVKFYEDAQPPVLRCFDVFHDQVAEMRLE